MHAYVIESNTKHKSPALALRNAVSNTGRMQTLVCQFQSLWRVSSTVPPSPNCWSSCCCGVTACSHLQVFACVSVLALAPCQGSRHQKLPVHVREIQECKCEELANSETLVYGVKASFLPLQMEETEPACVWHAVQSTN
jgi:hypothetical protein